jgi:hypothetical protein
VSLLRERLVMGQNSSVNSQIVNAIAATLPLDPIEDYVAGMVDLLKWPGIDSFTAIGLLDMLRDRLPGAPSEGTSVEAMIKWLRITYPFLNLTEPSRAGRRGRLGRRDLPRHRPRQPTDLPHLRQHRQHLVIRNSTSTAPCSLPPPPTNPAPQTCPPSLRSGSRLGAAPSTLPTISPRSRTPG